MIGGGVVGVTTAYYLSQKGLNVTVLEAQEKDADFGAAAGYKDEKYIFLVFFLQRW